MGRPVIRIACVPALAALLLAALPAPAQIYSLDGKEAMSKLKADCSALNMEEDKVQSCLARAQALGETNPSPELDAIQAKLEERASQAFDPNGLDQPTTEHSLQSAAQNRVSQSNDPPPPPSAPPGGYDETPPPAHILQDNDADADPPPVMPDKAEMDDGPPPDITTDDVPPPDNPPPDDDTGPGH
jgi:hypothetical protein